jgi:hypothetical protein
VLTDDDVKRAIAFWGTVTSHDDPALHQHLKWSGPIIGNMRGPEAFQLIGDTVLLMRTIGATEGTKVAVENLRAVTVEMKSAAEKMDAAASRLARWSLVIGVISAAAGVVALLT